MKWVLAEPDAGITAALSDRAGLHPLVARLMVNRGITDPAAATSFLACDLASLTGPSLFLQMDRAAARIRAAIEKGEPIAVYGDYDVDGVTGTALLYLVLKRLGGNVTSYIPDRLSEGYGLNAGALDKLKASGITLVITVDCGVTALREAEAALSLGLDLIITDHHEIEGHGPRSSGGLNCPPDLKLPRAYAVLHPALTVPSASPTERDAVSCLTGVGIAFKLAQAMLGAGADDEMMRSLLDLVTLGTVADVGRIVGENRVLVRHGLELLSSDSSSQRPGIVALKQVAGLTGKRVGVGTVGFTIAPRINASGRLERADMAFRLLTTDSKEEAMNLASALDAVNRERQSVEETISIDAKQQCRQADTAALGAIVLSSGSWHPGVIGIVASRLVDEFFRPTALISVQNGVGKGSARSVPGFDLYEGLNACSDLLLGFGGHKYAAGFTIAEENITPFRERLNAVAQERMGPAGFVRTLSVDGPVALDELTMDLMQELDKLSPFGQGNPEPRLGARGLEVIGARIVGNNHLKFRVRQGNGAVLGAIAFNRGSLLGGPVREGSRLAAVFTPRLNVWNGSTTLELDIKDIKPDR